MNNSYVNRDCPPLMSDGRLVTDYRPSCELHSSILYQNGLCDSNQYRHFMIHNANRMMNMNAKFYENLRGCRSCKFVHPDPNGNDSYWAQYRKNLFGQNTYRYNGRPYIYE